MKNFFLILTCFLLTLPVYSQTNADVFDYGTVENNVYTNSYFNLTMTIPSTWVIQSKGLTDTMVSKTINKMLQKDPSLKPIFKAQDIKDAVLIMANRYKMGAAVEFNHGIILMAENIMKFPEIETADQYLKQVKALLHRTKPEYVLDKKISKTVVNGITFYALKATIPGAIEINQIYYSTLIKGFSLSFIVTYNTNKQKKESLKILNTLLIKN